VTEDQSGPGERPGQVVDQSEARMREALERIGKGRPPREARSAAPAFSVAHGGRGSGEGQKRRFVREGEVPVMVVSGSRSSEGPAQRRAPAPHVEQMETLAATLQRERTAHETAERQLREAQAIIQDLRTKLGHVAIARDEALETARRAEAARATLAQEVDVLSFRLAAEVAGRAKAERAAGPGFAPDPAPRPPGAAEPASPRRRGRPPKADNAAQPAQAKRKPGRPRVEKEPEPVKWWLPKPGRSRAG
jgi:hypothetical protein